MAFLLSIVQLAKLLLEKEAKPNAVDQSGNTALHYCAFHNYPQIAELLIEVIQSEVCHGFYWLYQSKTKAFVNITFFSDVGHLTIQICIFCVYFSLQRIHENRLALSLFQSISLVLHFVDCEFRRMHCIVLIDFKKNQHCRSCYVLFHFLNGKRVCNNKTLKYTSWNYWHRKCLKQFLLVSQKCV